jgi:hypothetical protein
VLRRFGAIDDWVVWLDEPIQDYAAHPLGVETPGYRLKPVLTGSGDVAVLEPRPVPLPVIQIGIHPIRHQPIPRTHDDSISGNVSNLALGLTMGVWTTSMN